MKYKIVADSSCNIVSGEDSTFASVPMKIVAEREYVDDANLDVAQMVEDLKQYKGKSGSSCPNVGSGWKPSVTLRKFSASPFPSTCRAATTRPDTLPIRTWPSIRRERCSSSILWQRGRK